MNVQLLTHTPEALGVLFTAARTCYSATPAAEIWETGDGYSPEKMLGVVRGCIKRGHNSVIRHVSFTFAIDGISRACANQLTRHGPGWAFDQQSLRYVRLDSEPEWVVPDGLSPGERISISAASREAWDSYRRMIRDHGVKAEDARAVLPLCTPTNLIATCNLAAFMHFWGVRRNDETGKAQAEIKTLADTMGRLIVAAEPWLAEFITAP
jgi:thymidylate synthase (FAD)